MEYSIGYTYYKELLNSLKKDKKNPTKRDVIEYLNKTAGIKGGVKKLTICCVNGSKDRCGPMVSASR